MRMNNRSPFVRARHRQKAQAGELFIYDEIGFFGVQAEDFVRDLNAIEADEIHLRINSPGGSVFDGQAIIAAMRSHPSRTIAHVDGLAASMASGIAVAADEVRMAEGAFMMIHNVWSIILGDADALRREANVLDKIGTALANNYAMRSGQPIEVIVALMSAETWFTAEEAVAVGLADVVDDGETQVAAFDFSVFQNTPEQLMGQPNRPAPKELERLLRDAGLSRAEAKAFVAEGRKALNQRDVDEGFVSRAAEQAGYLRGKPRGLSNVA